MLGILATVAFAGNHCDGGGPGDAGLITLNGNNYATIDDAVAHAGTGDTIFVCQGSYTTSAVISKPIVLHAVDGPDLTRLDGVHDPTLSKVWVLEIKAPGQSAVEVDGFSIVGSDTTRLGILVDVDSELTLSDSKVFGNQTGLELGVGANLVMLDSEVFGNSNGGIGADADNVVNLSGSSVHGNFAKLGAKIGGGLALGDGVTVTGGDVFGNTAGRGGGVAITGAVTLIGTRIFANSADSDGAGVLVSRFTKGGSSLTALGVSITGNIAKHDGGGIFAESPVKGQEGFTTLDLERCTISDNRAGDLGVGGGIRSGARTVTATATSIYKNHAGLSGGGLFVDDPDENGSTYTDLDVESNDAKSCAGVDVQHTVDRTVFIGAKITDNVAVKDGGGVCLDPPFGSTTHPFAGTDFQYSTIARNTAGNRGGGFFVTGDQAAFFSTSTIVDSFIEDNVAKSGGALAITTEEVQVRGSIVKGNTASEGAGATLSPSGSIQRLLSSENSSWGNTPSDVQYTGGASFVYGTTDFSCDGNTCTP